ncbi:hypothetical protein VP01_4547g2 [Puccinia sorghi]|uniref:Uncharacterized protein n=1 Tax=Puccinia sorghi TaxID=27349 RepID=A0A0L6UQT5_9BASI|nr:hypothetical protein VP01_4547g2 [Puccinia sorghi]
MICVPGYLQADTPELGDHAKKLDDNGLITWLVSVPHGGPFAVKNKVTIQNDHSFPDFIEIVSALWSIRGRLGGRELPQRANRAGGVPGGLEVAQSLRSEVEAGAVELGWCRDSGV